ncbi:MAG: hypothetical protein ABIG89_03185 [Candidatus Woesearchaeota archaeon]
MDEIRFRLPKGMDKILKEASEKLDMKPNEVAKVALQNFLKDIGAFDLKMEKIEKDGKKKQSKK